VNNELLEKEPCRRPSGNFRAYFSTRAEAEAFAADSANWPVYKGDIAHLCGKCGRWHQSSRVVGAGICPPDDERELMVSRRTFILCGAVALLPLPAPLPTTAPWGTPAPYFSVSLFGKSRRAATPIARTSLDVPGATTTPPVLHPRLTSLEIFSKRYRK
jgi:hypothetical protein